MLGNEPKFYLVTLSIAQYCRRPRCLSVRFTDRHIVVLKDLEGAMRSEVTVTISCPCQTGSGYPDSDSTSISLAHVTNWLELPTIATRLNGAT